MFFKQESVHTLYRHSTAFMRRKCEHSNTKSKKQISFKDHSLSKTVAFNYRIHSLYREICNKPRNFTGTQLKEAKPVAHGPPTVAFMWLELRHVPPLAQKLAGKSGGRPGLMKTLHRPDIFTAFAPVCVTCEIWGPVDDSEQLACLPRR